MIDPFDLRAELQRMEERIIRAFVITGAFWALFVLVMIIVTGKR